MEALLIMLLMPLPAFLGRLGDPSPGIFTSREEARNLDCTRMSQLVAHERFPGQVPEPPARDFGQADALTCARRFMLHGERPARDELILSSLRETTAELVSTASALEPGDVTWHVDAFYPEPRVAAKIAVAARMELAERGRRVSDRVPVLAAGDIAVLGQMAPTGAYSLACGRYFAQGVLSERDAFLGLMIVDPREAQLHAGLCSRGKWRWLR